MALQKTRYATSWTAKIEGIWVVLQKLSQLSDTHFYQVLNKLEKIFFLVL